MNKKLLFWVAFLMLPGFPTGVFSREIEWKENESVVRTIEDQKVISERTEAFNKSLEHKGYAGAIKDCSDIYDFPVGVASANHSFGSICTYQHDQATEKVFVCNDLMVGHFAMLYEFTDTDQWQARAIFENCYGG
ncbi:hypothetical protein [Pseudomonas brassicacearum]|uniref:hypothetical protein n=1 Tax=Pseudomonas brassicacearum TaxID=930166 RepID=UPI001E160448|nr:hypothetical protein [Pseudomonas brassicacearum]CAH0235122.1 hypothetical protein SRABI06_02747 [Pseudomonas brassicacearum]